MKLWRKALLFFFVPVLLSSSVALAQLGGGPLGGAESLTGIEKLRMKGILPGSGPAGEPAGAVIPVFEPADPVTRAEMARMLVSALGAGADARALSGVPTRFSDVGGGHWAAGYVEAAAELGIFRGYGDGMFRPEGEVSRVELAAIMVRALGWEKQVSNSSSEASPFIDEKEIPSWGRGYVALAARQGIVRGFEDGRFRPSRATLRSEAAALVARLVDGRGALFNLSGSLAEIDLKGQKVVIGSTPAAMAPDAVIFQDGLDATLADLRRGDSARAILDGQGQVRYLETRGSYALGRVTEVTVSGKTRTISLSGARTIAISGATRIFLNGRPGGLEQIRAGDRAFISFNGWSGEVQAVDVTRIDLSGRVLESTGQGLTPSPASFNLTVAADGGSRRTLAVSPDAVAFLNGSRVSPAEILAGDRVSLALGPGDTVTFVEALR